MGRRGAIGDRECAAGETRLVRHVSATRRTGRISFFRGNISGPLEVAHRRTIFRLWLAYSVPGECRACTRWLVCAAYDYRDARVSRCPQPAGAREGADAHSIPRTP